ncbi:hypothetical protein ACSRUE_01505 [Sorangium sp. KYC3313]|uniref:hypothetical protein n=1 Tax=Sorangium sp. KYC3313 TaxID=3449740 RepID=UPI003F8A42E7
MSRSSRARVERRQAQRAAAGHAGRSYLVRWPLPPVPSWARFGEPAGPEHEAAHAAIHDALTRYQPAAAERGSLVVVGADTGAGIIVSFEAIERFAAAIAAKGHPDVAAALRRPVASGMVRTLAVSRLETFQTGAIFWPERPINTVARGAA